jgi:hypothetical protein
VRRLRKGLVVQEERIGFFMGAAWFGLQKKFERWYEVVLQFAVKKNN